MDVRREDSVVGRTLHRVSWAVCLLGIFCTTWRALEEFTGRHEAARALKASTTGRIVVDRTVGPTGERQQAVPRNASSPSLREPGGNRTVENYRPAKDEEGVPVAEDDDEEGAPSDEEQGKHGFDLDPDQFWKAYSEDRYSLLTRGVVAGEGDGRDGGDEGDGLASNDTSRRVRPTKYLVYVTSDSCGLGNHMSGMMSAFVLSIATGRVFLHDWTKPRALMGARYHEVFVPPFEPWASSATTGSPLSGPDGPLEVAVEDNDDGGSAGGLRSDAVVEETVGPGGSVWEKPLEITLKRPERCFLDFTPGGGVRNRHFVDVFIDKRGQDPRPDCPVVFVLSSQTIAAHARALFLQDASRRDKFVGCVGQLALSNNVSTVVLATEAEDFRKRAKSTLGESGVDVVTASSVEHPGEGPNPLSKTQSSSIQELEALMNRGTEATAKLYIDNTLALMEMMLVGEADIVVTSPRSSFSALAAAREGPSTQRFGGISCERLVNDPEFHALECAKDEWKVPQVQDPKRWKELYPFVDSNTRRCKS